MTEQQYNSNFLNILKERGFMYQMSDEKALDKELSSGIVPAYIGFDCTARSLHVGSLVQIMMLRWLQKCGHKPIILLGGGTSKVGDPSGKDKSREMLTMEDLENNKAGIRKVFAKYIKFGDGETDAVMVDNDDWLNKLQYLDFLRDYGPHFSVNRMMNFESVKIRLEREQPLTFLEFNYMILQAYDFLELGRRYGCKLQMGGSDQWGNMINGLELNRRVDSRSAHVITSPLLTTADGKKMGKSEGGAVWLNDDMLSDHDFWQYWRNVQDADVGKFLRLFTELPLDEIAKLESLEGSEINEAKKILAGEVTKLARSEDSAKKAQDTAQKTFEQNGMGDALTKVEVSRAELTSGILAFKLFASVGLVSSSSEARRLISGGGAKVNNEKVTNDKQEITLNDLDKDGVIKLSAGKKKHIIVVPV